MYAYLEEFLHPGSAAAARAAAVPVGETVRTELGEGIFGLEQAYLTKTRAEGRLESHRKYIDVQMMLAGSEWMDTTDIAQLEVSEDLTPDKDLIFYRDAKAISSLRLNCAGMTAVYFPVDAHRGGIMDGTPALARKIVVKVPVFG
ncbi:MAG: YhcH/YjgK/YiaL family protein [Opitutales bacterium]